MFKVWIGTILSLLSAIICWSVGTISAPSDFEMVIGYAAVCFSILFICLLCVCIGKRIRKGASAYRIFAATDIIIGIGSILYAIFDIFASADSMFFPGLYGWLLLLYVVPVVLLLLLIDYAVYRKRKRRTRCFL